MQRRIFGKGGDCGASPFQGKVELLGSGKSSYIENDNTRGQGTGDIPVERSEQGERSLVLRGLLIGDRKVDLSTAVVGLEGEGAFEFQDCLGILANLHQHRTQRAMSLGDIGCEPDYFLELLFGGRKV